VYLQEDVHIYIGVPVYVSNKNIVIDQTIKDDASPNVLRINQQHYVCKIII